MSQRFEKNPGPDWIVEYQWLGESDEGVESMMVFGVATSEIALEEAQYSLNAGKTPYFIIGVKGKQRRMSQRSHDEEDGAEYEVAADIARRCKELMRGLNARQTKAVLTELEAMAPSCFELADEDLERRAQRRGGTA